MTTHWTDCHIPVAQQQMFDAGDFAAIGHICFDHSDDAPTVHPLGAPTELTLLEGTRAALAARLAAVCAEPSPWFCAGERFESSLDCSVKRGQLTEDLMEAIEHTNAQILALIDPSAHAMGAAA